MRYLFGGSGKRYPGEVEHKCYAYACKKDPKNIQFEITQQDKTARSPDIRSRGMQAYFPQIQNNPEQHTGKSAHDGINEKIDPPVVSDTVIDLRDHQGIKKGGEKHTESGSHTSPESGHLISDKGRGDQERPRRDLPESNAIGELLHRQPVVAHHRFLL